MHFTRIGDDPRAPLPIIVSGEGCYVYDADGKRYLDGLSALYCVNAGHCRPELAAAAAEQMRELDFFTTWSYAHPRAIELAERIAALAPGDLNRVFFTSGGSEAVESAIKLSRNFHRLGGKGQKTKVIAREIAYHGTSLGALSVTGITSVRSQFEPLAPGGCHVPNTDSYRWPPGRDPLWAAEQIAARIEFEGPETVAAVILEPVQNGGRLHPAPGRLLPACARDLRRQRRAADLRRGDLLVGSARPLVRLGPLRLRPGHHHDGQGNDLGERSDGRDDRLGRHRGAVPRPRRDVRPRLHVRRTPGRRGRRAGQHRPARA
jgi:adenosylmethionine-8-amino-7-oxononanoate aminotransferase